MPIAQQSSTPIPAGSTYQLTQTAYGLNIGEIFTKGDLGYQSTTHPELFIDPTFLESSPLFTQTTATVQAIAAASVVLKTYQVGATLTVLNAVYGLLLGDTVIKLESGEYQSIGNPGIFIAANAVENNANFQ